MKDDKTRVRQITIYNTGEYMFSLAQQDQIFPGMYALAIITPVDLRSICDCDEFQELVWGNQRITILMTPEQVINCIMTRSSITLLMENIYYVPGNTYVDKIPKELVETINRIEYYYSIIKEILKRKTLFLLNKEKYNYSINNVISIRDLKDLKNHIAKLMKSKNISEDIIYYFINENLTTWYLRKMVKR